MFMFCQGGHVSIRLCKKVVMTRLWESLGEEIKLAEGLLDKTGLPGQNVPLIRNGCANTTFNLRALKKVL